MAKLETQINQIFLTHPEAKTNLQLMHDEAISNSSHLFLVAEIKSIKKKTEEQDLKKIFETILVAFRGNKKLPGETLFESSLAQINDDLADLAHKGRKNWVNKFSAVIALKTGDNLYLANCGSGQVLLKRKLEISEILSNEKKDQHALKTFQNFTMGKIKENDCLIITLNNIFNYISLSLFIKILGETSIEEAINRFTQILKDSASSESFACFILRFSKEQPVTDHPAGGSHLPAGQAGITDQPIYAPLPETEPEIVAPLPDFRGAVTAALRLLGKIQALRLPSFATLRSFGSQTPAKKFFLISFLVFLLLFGTNVVVFGFRLGTKKHQEKVEAKISSLTNLLHEAEGSLIYKNDQQSFELLNNAWNEFRELEKLEPEQAAQISAIIKDISNKVNRVSVISNPQVISELKFAPDYLTRAGSGFLLAGKDSKNLAFLSGQNNLQYIFVLNNPSEEVRGIIHAPNLGHVFLAGSKIYRVNETQKQAETIKTVTNADALGLKLLSPNRIYTADKNTNQILRFTYASGSLSDSPALLKSQVEIKAARDFGLDKDIYILFPDKIKKFVNGTEMAFTLPALSEPMTEAAKLVVGTNLYVLDPAKKRLLIFSKQGGLLNQIIFANAQSLTDFYIDEQQRNIYLLDGAKLLSITF